MAWDDAVERRITDLLEHSSLSLILLNDMPTVTVERDRFFAALGKAYTVQAFEELCFAYGLELDAVTEELVEDGMGGRRMRSGIEVAADSVDGRREHSHQRVDQDAREVLCAEQSVPCLKIEVPANRYDLLCFEGLVQALRVFLGADDPRHYTLRSRPTASVTFHVRASAYSVRPFLVCAVLRNIDLRDRHRYQSLMDLQDKLHQNLGRRRSLVAIGTHDLDTVREPFVYEARAPQHIRFRPLAESQEMDAVELMQHYAHDKHLKKYLPLIRDSPRYPVICDADGRVLSLPPMINGDWSKVRTSTRNLLIECTATDYTKATVVLNTLVAMFSRYASPAFEVEPVRVVYEAGAPTAFPGFAEALDAERAALTPDLRGQVFRVRVSEVSRLLGVSLGAEQMQRLLARMQLQSASDADDADVLHVEAPAVRSDVLHACDIAEDVAIAFGFDRLPERTDALVPVGGWQPLQILSDLVRREFAQQGYLEVLTWVTVSHEENATMLQREASTLAARTVHIANPKTLEFQACRTTLLTGLLKTLRENRDEPLPLRLFEVGDVVLRDAQCEVGARNERHAAAVYTGIGAGFEVMKHLVDRVMEALDLPRCGYQSGYHLDADACTDALFFPGRRAHLVVQRRASTDAPPRPVVFGTMGWVHPRVLQAFGLTAPASAMEVNLELACLSTRA